MLIDRETHLLRSEQVLSQQAAEQVVLLSLADGQYYALDEVGGRIWELCDGSRSVAEMASLLAQEFDAPTEVLEADALELLTDLASAELVRTAGSGAARGS